MKLQQIALAEVAELEKIKDKRLVKEDRALAGKQEEMLPAQEDKEVKMVAALAGLLTREASIRVVVKPVLAMVARMERDKVKLAKVELVRQRVRAARARDSVSLKTKIAVQSPKLVAALQAKQRSLQRIVINRIRMAGPMGLAGVKANSKRPISNSTRVNTNEPQVALWHKVVTQLIQLKLSKSKTFTLTIQEGF